MPLTRLGRGLLSWASLASVSRRELLVALATAAWLSLEYLGLGPLSWIYGYGGTLETLPTHLSLIRTGAVFQLWAPGVAGGVDRFSFWGNADPLNVEPLLFSLLPIWLANGLHVFAQRLLAVYFTMRVAREHLGMSPGWAIAAGIFHGAFSYYTTGEILAFPSVPLMIWLLWRLTEARRWILWSLVAGLAFSPLTTFSHSVPYLGLFALLWFAIVRRGRPRVFLVIGCFFAALGLAESPQMIAVLYNAPFSHRAAFPPDTLSWTADGLFYYRTYVDFLGQNLVLRAITIWAPHVMLAAGLLASLRGPRRHQVFLAVAALFIVLELRFAFVLAQQALAVALPWVTGITMVRFHAVPASFLIAIICATGLRAVLQETPNWLHRPLVGTFGAVVVVALIWPKVALFSPLMLDGWGEANFQVRALDELRTRDRDLYRVASVPELQPGYAYGQGFEAADGWSNLYPAVYRELWLRVLTPLFREVPAAKQVFAPEVGRPQDHYIFLGLGLTNPANGLLPGEDARAALETGFDVDRRFNLHLLGMLNVKYLFSAYPLKSEALRLVHAPSPPPVWPYGRDYATGLINGPRPPEDDPSPLGQLRRLPAALERRQAGKDVYIYENQRWLPRFRFVERALVEPTPMAMLDRLERLPSTELAVTAVLEQATAAQAGVPATLSAGSAEVACYTPDEIVLRTENAGDGLLVAAMTWNPYWTALVDGTPQPLLRANHAQLAVRTPAGVREVRLRYRPPYAVFGVGRLAPGASCP